MGCADVCLDHGYDDDNDFFDQRMVVARKEWRCCECQLAIRRGTRHEYSVGKNDGAIFTERTCSVCAEIRDAFVCGSFVFGQLWGSIEEEIFPVWAEAGPWDCMAKLNTQAARDHIQGQYDEWAKEQEGD